jgi:hypothetical protein
MIFSRSEDLRSEMFNQTEEIIVLMNYYNGILLEMKEEAQLQFVLIFMYILFIILAID